MPYVKTGINSVFNEVRGLQRRPTSVSADIVLTLPAPVPKRIENYMFDQHPVVPTRYLVCRAFVTT